MIPCNADDEVNDSWILTADRQFKHEQTGLCIGRFVICNFKLNFEFSISDRKNLDRNFLHAAVCDSLSRTQKWEFQNSKRH